MHQAQLYNQADIDCVPVQGTRASENTNGVTPSGSKHVLSRVEGEAGHREAGHRGPIGVIVLQALIACA